MSKGWIAAWAVIVGITAASCNAAPADAAPGVGCEHRGGDHIARHGGKAEDDAYHRLHHERVTCDGPGEESGDRYPQERHDGKDEHHDGKHHDDDPGDGTPLYRDHEGYHCYMLRCG